MGTGTDTPVPPSAEDEKPVPESLVPDVYVEAPDPADPDAVPDCAATALPDCDAELAAEARMEVARWCAVAMIELDRLRAFLCERATIECPRLRACRTIAVAWAWARAMSLSATWKPLEPVLFGPGVDELFPASLLPAYAPALMTPITAKMSTTIIPSHTIQPRPRRERVGAVRRYSVRSTIPSPRSLRALYPRGFGPHTPTI